MKKIIRKVKKGQDVTVRKKGSGDRNEIRGAATVTRVQEMVEQKEGLTGQGASKRAISAALKTEGADLSATGAPRAIKDNISVKSFAQV